MPPLTRIVLKMTGSKRISRSDKLNVSFLKTGTRGCLYATICSVMQIRKVIGLILFFSILLSPVFTQERTKDKELVRIGIFPYEPVNFIDDYGKASGINPELIQVIAEEAGWKVRYVEGSLEQGLERLQNGEIDLMLSVARSPEREKSMDFCEEYTIGHWSQVFMPPEKTAEDINDLQGLNIGITRADINDEALKETALSFGVEINITGYATHHEVFRAIENGEVDAGTAPQHFGIRNRGNYKLDGTQILFSPASLYIAAKKGENSHLLEEIDRTLKAWKAEKDSIYYRTVTSWMSIKPEEKDSVPLWVRVILALALFLGILTVVSLLLMHRIINSKTEAIRLGEARYKNLFNQIENIIIILDKDLHILQINPFGLSFLEKTEDEMIGKSIRSLNLLPDEAMNLYHLNSLQFVDMVSRIFIADKVEHIRWTIKPMEDTGDNRGSVLCEGVQITDLVESETALRESQDQFTSFMNNLPAYTYLKNTKGEHLYSNAATKALVHVRKEQYRTSDFQKGEEGLKLIQEANARLISGESEIETIEYEAILGDKNIHQRLRETIFPIHLPNGEIRLGGIAFDISETHAIQEQLNQARKMQAIGELAGGIAHDFNNQLSGIMGYADLLIRGIDDPEKERYAQKLVKGIERASETTKQLLNFSRKENRETRSIRVNEVINDMINLLSHSMEKTVTIHFDQQAENDLIQGDPNQIQNALLNIAINARDAMRGTGDLYFTTQIIKANDKMVALQGYAMTGYYLRVSVEDTGKGMSRETQDKIFEPFFTTKDEGEGTGMGLAMVYSTLKDHDGNVTVQSTPGKGTVFSLYFPSAMDETVGDAQESEDGSYQNEASSGPYNIAIIDDEYMIRDFLSLSLREKGHRVALFEGGKQAITAFTDSNVKFDLVILDMIMPGMDGPETYRELMKIKPELPVLLSSGYSRKEDLLNLIQKPRVLYLQKPYSITDLYAAIEKLMRECAVENP